MHLHDELAFMTTNGAVPSFTNSNVWLLLSPPLTNSPKLWLIAPVKVICGPLLASTSDCPKVGDVASARSVIINAKVLFIPTQLFARIETEFVGYRTHLQILVALVELHSLGGFDSLGHKG